MEDKTLDYIYENLRLYQYGDGLKYGTDALLLSAFVRGGSEFRAVDLGTGNGVLPLTLVHNGKAAHVTGIEIQSQQAELAAKNAELNGLSDKINIVCADFQGDLAELAAHSFDYAVSNPPYMKCAGFANQNDGKNIARHEVMCTVDGVCRAAARMVRFGGDFYVVYRPDRLCDLFCALRAAGLEPKTVRFVHAKTDLRPCLVLVAAKYGARAGNICCEPFFIYGADGNVTPEMKAVYEGKCFI